MVKASGHGEECCPPLVDGGKEETEAPCPRRVIAPLMTLICFSSPVVFAHGDIRLLMLHPARKQEGG